MTLPITYRRNATKTCYFKNVAAAERYYRAHNAAVAGIHRGAATAAAVAAADYHALAADYHAAAADYRKAADTYREAAANYFNVAAKYREADDYRDAAAAAADYHDAAAAVAATDCCNAEAVVRRKLADGQIRIGKPPLKRGEYCYLVDNGTRYAVAAEV